MLVGEILLELYIFSCTSVMFDIIYQWRRCQLCYNAVSIILTETNAGLPLGHRRQ